MLCGWRLKDQGYMQITLKQKKETRIKVESSYSSLEDFENGARQSSPLFKVFICGMSLMLDKTYFAGYADDNTPQCVIVLQAQKHFSEVVKYLEEISNPLIKWFKGSQMKLSPDKCHSILSHSLTLSGRKSLS